MNILLGATGWQSSGVTPGYNVPSVPVTTVFAPQPAYVDTLEPEPTWQVSYPAASVASVSTVASTPQGQMINAQGKYYTPTPGALEYARSHPNWIDPAAIDANNTGPGGGSASVAASNAADAAGRITEAARGAATARASDYAAAYTTGFMTAGMEPPDAPAASMTPLLLLAAAAAAYFAMK